MINYFFNITSKEDEVNFYTDILTNIRKDFYLTKEKQKAKLTQNSDSDSVFYDFSLEKEKPLKWSVSDNDRILSDVRNLEDGKYCVNFYNQSGLIKQITFSQFHTLLKVEYFNMEKSTTPYFIIEPRKSNNGLCLLTNVVGSFQSVILFAMPDIDDDYILDKVNLEFTDYSAVASTNEGVVRFLDSKQLEAFEEFVDRAQALKLTETAPVSYIDESDAVLASKLNPKDFNVKRNLSQLVDISQADEFSFEVEDLFDFDEQAQSDVCDYTVLHTDSEEVTEVVENDSQNTVDECQQIDETLEKEPEYVSVECAADDSEQLDTHEPSHTASDTPDLTDFIETESSDAVVDDIFDDEFIVAQNPVPDSIIESFNAKYLYFGETDSNNNRVGFGRTTTEDGHTAYEGRYINNKRDGLGAYYYKDGQLCYYGNWKQNKRDGFGVGVSSFDNSVHIGTFKDNKPVLDGVRVSSNGDIRFIKKVLSNNVTVVMEFEGDKVIVKKYNPDGEMISENSSNLIYF